MKNNTKINMNKLSKTEKAYIAGLLDGEGCVGISIKKSKAKSYEYDFQLRVIITNSYYPVICWLKEKTGIGCAYESKYKVYNPKWNHVHRWQVVSDQARAFLKTIKSYLIIKKEIAELILQLPMARQKGRIHAKRTPEEYRRQIEIFNLAKEKNKRGTKSA